MDEGKAEPTAVREICKPCIALREVVATVACDPYLRFSTCRKAPGHIKRDETKKHDGFVRWSLPVHGTTTNSNINSSPVLPFVIWEQNQQPLLAFT